MTHGQMTLLLEVLRYEFSYKHKSTRYFTDGQGYNLALEMRLMKDQGSQDQIENFHFRINKNTSESPGLDESFDVHSYVSQIIHPIMRLMNILRDGQVRPQTKRRLK